jgi:hypothetical protein
MNTFAKSLLLLLILTSCQSNIERDDESDHGLWFFVLVKSNNYSQNAEGELTLLNYHFFSEIFARRPELIDSASLNRLGNNARTYTYEDKGETFYYEGGHFDSQEELDAAHPNGEYRFDIQLASGEVIDKTLSFQGPGGLTDIPQPIHISFLQGNQLVRPDRVNPDEALLVRWSPYSNGRSDPNGIVDDMIFVVFQDCNGERIFHTGLPFKESSYMTYATQEVTVPVGSFKPGQTYSMFVEFPHVVESGQDNGVSGFTSFATATYLDVKSTGVSTMVCPDKMPPLDTGQTDRMEQVKN